MTLLRKLIVFAFVVLQFPNSSHQARVSIIRDLSKLGQLKGYRERVAKIRDVDHFLSIPFARPPTGQRRFKHPEPVEPWTGVKDASGPPAACWQSPGTASERANPAARMWLNNTLMSEDCLYLSVWAPSNDNKIREPLAVMVWIYGGGFFQGSNALDVYNGAVLAAKSNVIVVSMQYRLGPFGFLYLGTSDAPGNQGLMDQRQALIWVNSNIREFGGDPDRVTIFGESAGAASVSLQILSPLSQRYFSQAILQSASALADWAVDSPASALQKASEVSQACGCQLPGIDPERSIACLRTVDPATLITQQDVILQSTALRRRMKLDQNGKSSVKGDASLYFEVPLKPVVDHYFLPSSIEDILRKGSSSYIKKKLKVMLGVNKNEGMYFLLPYLNNLMNSSRFADTYDMVGGSIIKEDLLYPVFIPMVLFEYQIPSTRLGYRPWRVEEAVKSLDNAAGDLSFKCPVILFANELSQLDGLEVYLYSFEQRTASVTWPGWTGVMHGYEIEYVFGMPFSVNFTRQFYGFNEAERQVSERMMQMWSNFAKTGNATLNEDGSSLPVKWPLYQQATREHLIITAPADRMKTGRNLRSRQCLFWSQLLPDIRQELQGNEGNCDTPTPIGLWPFTPESQGQNTMKTGNASLIHVLPADGLNDTANSALRVTGKVNSYIVIPLDNLAKDLEGSSYTVTAYIYLESAFTGPILEFYNAQNKTYYSTFWVFPTYDRLHMHLPEVKIESAAGVLQLNNWYYVAAVNDNTAKRMRIYRDTELVADGSYRESYGPVVGNDGYIGWTPRHPTGKHNLNARIFCLQIFNVALSRSQIANSRRNCQELRTTDQE